LPRALLQIARDKILLLLKQGPPFLPAVVSGAFNRHSIRQKAVTKTGVGYCGGSEPNPTYELVSSKKPGYRESIQITYDPAKISYDQLLDIYWRQIDPTQADGQFTDIGPSYRAAIFYGKRQRKKSRETSKRNSQARENSRNPL